MENLYNKNVIVSVLAGILIIFGAFYSSVNNSSQITNTYEGGIAYEKKMGEAIEEGISAIENQEGYGFSAENSNPSNNTAITLYSNLKPHTREELNIIDIPSRASDKGYGLELAKILGQYSSAKSISPVEITNSMYETKDYSDVNKISTLKQSYLNEVTSLLLVRVPKDIAVSHLNLINNLDRMSQLLENIAKIESDELTAITSTRQFALETEIQIAILREINKYYTDKNISFGSVEKANVYANIIR